MTQTTFEIDFLTGSHEVLGNYVLNANMMENLLKIGELKFTAEEHAFAREIIESVPTAMFQATRQAMIAGLKPGTSEEEIGQYLNEKPVEPNWDYEAGGGASTDVGDVSYITPTGQIFTSTFPIGIPFHSWQSVVASGSSFGFKAGVHAAKVMALSTLDLFTQPDLLQAAKDEFIQSTGGKKYASPLPEGAKPH